MPSDVTQSEMDLGGQPGELCLVLRVNPQTGRREMGKLTWGLLPHNTLDPGSAPRPTHARAETIAMKPLFADAFRRRRAIVPVDEFYIRNTLGARGGRRYAISRRDKKPVALAGLWEGFRWPNGEVMRSFCVVTVPANEMISPYHDRMPLVLDEPDFAVWLGEKDGDPVALLRPPPPELLVKRALGRG